MGAIKASKMPKAKTIRRKDNPDSVTMYAKGGSVKDECYSKVKARYKVFPSAYASGAISKCRKVGAKNWGKGGKGGRS
jgi:hypothetical protein